MSQNVTLEQQKGSYLSNKIKSVTIFSNGYKDNCCDMHMEEKLSLKVNLYYIMFMFNSGFDYELLK